MKENNKMQKTAKERRLDAYRDWIQELMDKLEDVVDELDDLQGELEDEKENESESAQASEAAFRPAEKEDRDEDGKIEMQIVVALPNGLKFEIPYELLGGQDEH